MKKRFLSNKILEKAIKLNFKKLKAHSLTNEMINFSICLYRNIADETIDFFFPKKT